MTIKSKNFNKKLARAKWWSDLRFKVRKLRFMRKILKNILKHATANNNYKDVNELQLFPSDFIKLSDEQIERGLNMFVERRELASWSHIKEQNADGYLVVFPDENRSQERFLNRIPQQINLNDVNLEPLTPKEQEKPAETSKANQSEEPTKEAHPEQSNQQAEDNKSKQPAEPTNNEDDEDYSKPF